MICVAEERDTGSAIVVVRDEVSIHNEHIQYHYKFDVVDSYNI